MKNIRPGLGLLALSLAAAVSAAELISVPVDLARYLTGGGRMYRGLPADFPDFTLPEGLSVMGAFEDERRQMVLLRSQPGGAEAQRAVVEDLLARGWIDMSAAERDRPYGFIVPEVNLAPVYLCHDSLGTLQVRGEDGAENRVYLQRRVPSPGSGAAPGCAEQAAASGAGQYIMPNFDAGRYLPDLQPPGAGLDVLGPPIRSISRIGFSSSGGGSLETELFAYAPDFTAAELGQHYAGQVREQGWTLDSAWGQEAHAGSHWTRRDDEGRRLLLSLLILPEAADRYSVSIRLVALAGEND